MKKLEEVSPTSRSIGIALGLTETEDALLDACAILACDIKPHEEGKHEELTEENVELFLSKGNGKSMRVSKLVVDTCEKYGKYKEVTPAVYAASGVAVMNVIQNLQQVPSPQMLLRYCYRLNDLLKQLAEDGVVVTVE